MDSFYCEVHKMAEINPRSQHGVDIGQIVEGNTLEYPQEGHRLVMFNESGARILMTSEIKKVSECLMVKTENSVYILKDIQKTRIKPSS